MPTGANLEVDAKIVLTVGSDCAIGKKTVAVELDLEARRRGLESVFVPTGQTGIAIAGWGIAVDAVVADFLAGAAERLVVEGAARGGKLLFVEGQGSLVHPLYSGVTLGLVHGSAPHAFVLCHRAGADRDRRVLRGIRFLRSRSSWSCTSASSLPRRPAKVVCVALNTADIDEDDRRTRCDRRPRRRRPACRRRRPVRFGSGNCLTLLDSKLQACVAIVPSWRLEYSLGSDSPGCGEPAEHQLECDSSLRQWPSPSRSWPGPRSPLPPTSEPTTTRRSTPPTTAPAMYGEMAAVGLRQTVIGVRFKPSEALVIQDKRLLDRIIPNALDAGLRVVLAVYPYPPREIEAGLGSPALFASYVAAVAQVVSRR